VAKDVGQVIAGRYRLVEILGRGGMGTVWRAIDESLGREVAIKQMLLLSDVDVVERLVLYARMEREARAAARLKHPGIITVYDRGVGRDGRPWIVMEIINGASLGDLITAEGRLTPPRVAGIGVQILDALTAAHESGVMHRDIKPNNILLDGDRVVLADFGIAAIDGDAALTHPGMPLGTASFMSPERIGGQPATTASDLWSVGATLYTAVEGHKPFTGPTLGAMCVAIATQNPASAVHAGPLAPMLEGLLRKDPARRFTAAQAMTMLAGIANGTEHEAAQDTGHPDEDTGQGDSVSGQPPEAGQDDTDRYTLRIDGTVAGHVVIGNANTITTDPTGQGNG
jgi:eukaryotic-like serine/threonine-protein kinase